MKQTGKDIEDFFAKMRQEDSELQLPDFEDMVRQNPKPKKHFLITFGVAASFLILFIAYMSWEKSTRVEIDKEQEAVILPDSAKGNAEPLLEEEDLSVYSWEAPTTSLIDEFK